MRIKHDDRCQRSFESTQVQKTTDLKDPRKRKDSVNFTRNAAFTHENRRVSGIMQLRENRGFLLLCAQQKACFDGSRIKYDVPRSQPI